MDYVNLASVILCLPTISTLIKSYGKVQIENFYLENFSLTNASPQMFEMKIYLWFLVIHACLCWMRVSGYLASFYCVMIVNKIVPHEFPFHVSNQPVFGFHS